MTCTSLVTVDNYGNSQLIKMPYMRFKFLFGLRDIIIIDLKCEHY